jgi:dephospho-CoA kinase
VKAAMVGRLGEEILGAGGEIDRSRVAGRVFGDREALAWLEGLLHPKVSEEYLNWREQLGRLENPPEVCVTEVPLLYEVGGEKRFDKVVVITAPTKLREARARVPLAGRSDRLLPDNEKVERADYAYVNTGTIEELDAWVAGVMEELRAEPGPARR